MKNNGSLNSPVLRSDSGNMRKKRPLVSVIVPNYNYGRYLEKRIQSILVQTFKDFELIILDDASTDNSMELIGKYASLDYLRVIRNDRNSGNVFEQWAKGILAAQGDIIWIAEADDLAEPEFIATLLPFFNDPDVKLASCASGVIDENGNCLNLDYRETGQLSMISKDRWHKDYVLEGLEEIRICLGSRNTIFNVSSVMFRKPDTKILEESLEYKMSGDWVFYLNMLESGKIGYSAKTLNWHRKHEESVAAQVDSNAIQLLDEFFSIHSRNLKRFPFALDIYAQLKEYMDEIVFPFCANLSKEKIAELYSFEKLLKIARNQYSTGSYASRADSF